MTIELHDPRALRSWTASLLRAWGYRPADASYIAESLVDANERGTDSHGVIRLAAYEKRITAGLVDPAAHPRVEVCGSVVRVDAHGAAGQIAGRAAVLALTDLAPQTGVAMATVRGSAHFGAAGFYTRALASAGLIGMAVSNSEPAVVPFGGRDALLGTNPFACAAPSDAGPIGLDMATSTSAMGKVLVARNTGDSIPDTWGVDANGLPTTNPDDVTALLPVGGPKGYGLAFLVEILGGVLTGAAVAHRIGNMYSDFDRPQNVGHWMLAIDIAHLMPLAEFTARMQTLIDAAHGTAPAPGFDAVLVPGEPEQATARSRRADGIPIDAATLSELRALGDRYGVAFLDRTQSPEKTAL